MEQEVQQIIKEKNNNYLLVIVLSVAVTATVVGSGIFLWQKSTIISKNDGIEQENSRIQLDNANLKAQVEMLENHQTIVKQNQLAPLLWTFSIPEVSVNITIPGAYSLVKSTEQNRRGSFVSYELLVLDKNTTTPRLQEIQFFSEESIKSFNDKCEDQGFCFQGDYPDVKRFKGQKQAYDQGIDHENYTIKKFGNRKWFVSNPGCSTKGCVIREYTTFIGKTKMDLWIYMTDLEEEEMADKLFSQIKVD